MNDKVFVPFSEELLAAAGSPLGELVPYQREYRCIRLLDGTFEFTMTADDPETRGADLKSSARMVPAA